MPAEDDLAQSKGLAAWLSPREAVIAALTALATVTITGGFQLATENKKIEGSFILEALKTGGDQKQAANNLRFLLDTKLVRDSKRRADLRRYLMRVPTEDGPALGSRLDFSDPKNSGLIPAIQ